MSLAASTYITAEEYLNFKAGAPEKHEYVDGRIYDMAGASISHNFIVSNLIRELGSFLREKGCYVLPSDVRITIPGFNSYMYPDVTVFCDEIERQPGGFDTLTNPVIIIEVLSPATQGIDKGTKLFKYLQIPSLKEYIIVNTTEHTVQLMEKQADDSFKIHYTTGIDTTLFIPAIQMYLPMKEIYYMAPLEDAKR